MKRKTVILLVVVLLMTAFFIGCADKTSTQSIMTPVYTVSEVGNQKPEAIPQPTDEPIAAMNKVTVGLVYAGDDYETGLVKLNVQTLMTVSSIQINVIELEADAQNPLDSINELVDEGCNIIFISGIEDSAVIKAAEENPDVNFEIYGGLDTDSLENVSLFYTRIYQQQYLNGMIAGFMSSTGSIAYIAEKAENEDIRRANAFALGAKSANADAIVHFVWQGEDVGNEAANGILQSLLDENCDVLMKFQLDDDILEFVKENEIMAIGKSQSEYSGILKMVEPTIFEYILNKTRSTASHSYESNDIYEGWVGIKEYEIYSDSYPMLSQEDLQEIQTEINKMAQKSWDVFTGPITDAYGNTIIPDGVKIPDEDLFYMLWYVQNIQAMAPPMG